jgi:CubicO group peptidase (beta-lactamase class C family)
MTKARAPRGKRLADLTGVMPGQLVGKHRSTFESYVSTAITKFGVPGAAVAVIQGGEVSYLNGFGVKELGGAEPVTPDTRLMIGSITKPMTTMPAAALIDHGRLSWDTRLVDLLPQFAAGDRSMTERLTVRDAFCNCSGLPGRDLERYFKTGKLTPEETLTALAEIGPVASFGEQFIYNNLLVAAGGYAAGVAARGGTARDVGSAYDVAMRERVLGPIGSALDVRSGGGARRRRLCPSACGRPVRRPATHTSPGGAGRPGPSAACRWVVVDRTGNGAFRPN